MTLRILDDAAAEFADAIECYESIESGLGVRLKEEVKSALAWISSNPDLPRLLAIAHSARRPEYWINRETKPSE